MLHRASDKKIMPNVWMAPGGKRDHNEGLYEAVRREVKEETSLEVKNIQIKVVGNAYLKDLDTEVFFHLVRADYKSGKLKTEDGVGRLHWLLPNEILKLDNLLVELGPVLPHIFSENKNIISYKAEYKTGNKMSWFKMDR